MNTKTDQPDVGTQGGEPLFEIKWTDILIPGTSDEAYAAAKAGKGLKARQADDVRLRFVDMGDPKGTPIVLMHGWSSETGVWRFVIPLLIMAGFRVLAMDFRGHGIGSRELFDLDACADDVAGMLAVRGVKAAIVMAHSMGGAVAQRFASKYPALAKGLVFVASTAAFDTKGMRRLLSLARATVLVTFPRFEQYYTARGLRRYLNDFRDTTRRSDPRALVTAAAQMGFHDMREQVKVFKCPIAVVVHVGDQTIDTKLQQELSTLRADTKVFWVDAAHGALRDEPDKVVNEAVAAAIWVRDRAAERADGDNLAHNEDIEAFNEAIRLEARHARSSASARGAAIVGATAAVVAAASASVTTMLIAWLLATLWSRTAATVQRHAQWRTPLQPLLERKGRPLPRARMSIAMLSPLVGLGVAWRLRELIPFAAPATWMALLPAVALLVVPLGVTLLDPEHRKTWASIGKRGSGVALTKLSRTLLSTGVAGVGVALFALPSWWWLVGVALLSGVIAHNVVRARVQRERTARTTIEAGRRGRAMALAGGAVLALGFVNVRSVIVLAGAADELGATGSARTWLSLIAMLVQLGLLALGLALVDRFGRRAVLIGGLVAVAVGTLACALVDSAGQMTAAQAVVGVGGALTLAAAINAVAEQDAGRGQSRKLVAAGCYAVGLIAGWLVAELVVTGAWQQAFLIDMPVVVALLLAALGSSRRDVTTTPRRLDWVAVLAWTGGLGAVVFVAIDGPARGWLDSVVAKIGFAAVAALAYYLVRHQGAAVRVRGAIIAVLRAAVAGALIMASVTLTEAPALALPVLLLAMGTLLHAAVVVSRHVRLADTPADSNR